MRSAFSKKEVLTLFACLRQAERSVHYAVSLPSQWSEFVVFYDKFNQDRIAELIGMLKAAGAVSCGVPHRQATTCSEIGAALQCVVRFIINPLKNYWSFSIQEISFFSATLERLSMLLHSGSQPEKEELIDLRMDCWECHYIIERKLIGIREIRKAQLIEHFSQSEYVEHVTFQDLGIHNGGRQKAETANRGG